MEQRRQPLVPSPRDVNPPTPHLPGHAIIKGGQQSPSPETLPPLYRAQTPVGNIAKAIASVMREVGTVRKGGMNNFHHYAYARMEDLLHAITPLMGKYGLAVLQNEVSKTTVEDNQAAVTYDFVVIHESGEQLPPQRFTGMARFRDSKGNVDDKAVNKAHTAARKYFLLSLFQVPTGDFDDADADGGDRPPKQIERAVPGPSAVAPKTDTERAREWASKFIQKLGAATTHDEIVKLERSNENPLTMIYDNYADIYETIKAAIERRVSDLAYKPSPAVPRGMPDPRTDAQLAVNWVAQNLNEMKTYDAALAFWETSVKPNENLFDPPDFELLLSEWMRTETRLSPPKDELDDGPVGNL